jgi:hypothetical protein
VIRLTPDLSGSERRENYFAPRNWRELDERDADLGGSDPLLINIGSANASEPRVIALGKDAHAYVLDRNDLGGIGGELATDAVSTNRIITAPAAYPSDDSAFAAFGGRGKNCPRGEDGDLTVLKISAGNRPTISTAWCGDVQGRASPIVTTTDGRSNPIVWIVGAEGDDQLHGFRGDIGQEIFRSEPLEGLRHFQTLIAAAERLYVAADDRLYAFGF